MKYADRRFGSDALFHEARRGLWCSCGRKFREPGPLAQHVEDEEIRLRRQVLRLVERLALIAGVV